MDWIERGVNRALTTRRWARCSGSSWAIMFISSTLPHER